MKVELTVWRQAGPRILLTVGLYGLNHRYALLRLLNPPDPTLARWDAILAERDVVGLAAFEHDGPAVGLLRDVRSVRGAVSAPGGFAGVAAGAALARAFEA